MKLKIFTALIILCPMISMASEIHGKISAVDNLWVSAQNEQGGLVPSEWNLPNGLPTGERLIVGSVMSNSAQNISLTNGSDSITLGIAVLGIQYHVANYTTSVSEAGASATTTLVGNIITVMGSGGGDQSIEFVNQNSMIKLYRPIIQNIDINDIKTALQGKSKGAYTGILPVIFHYDYYRNDIRVKQIISAPLQITIDYNPAVIFSAIITSGLTGELTPRYHGYPQQVVSGQGKYSVRINGDFTSGLRAKIINTSALYTLKNSLAPAGDPTKEIAYNLTCTIGCTSNDQMIIEGQASSNFTQIDNTNINEVNIELTVGFENKPYEDLVNGKYSGQFQMLFEAQL